ncbi:zinc finger matrin-type protein 3 [Aethina tumida]|uniref:zinc finger matrin-type protein 3 n=1 Tax=Aethina tumida TaxID=116153 RepID=UPI0021499581|nr:zinc finger matrin-type protein 3 [Aethina tumida]
MSNGQNSEAHLNDYKIRLKKRKITDNDEYVNSPKPQTNTTPTVSQLQQQQQPPPLPPQSMLANSYHNYSMLNTYVPPTQPVLYYAAGQVPDTSLTQKICTALIATKEKPKNYDKNLFRDTNPDADDASLPSELTAMFQPLFCRLCSAHLSSNVMAKMHYKSKNHEKKIRKFLIDYSDKTGEPLHKRAKLGHKSKDPDQMFDNDPRYFHCDVCDLDLTGKLHAESHYMGKNHLMAVSGHRTPAGKGYYNEEGKWVRIKVEKKGEHEGGSGDGFGVEFRKADADKETTTEQPLSPSKSKTGAAQKPGLQSKFHCDFCNVGATCLQQLEMHLRGQKHLKKLKQLGINVAADAGGAAEGLSEATASCSNSTLLQIGGGGNDILAAYRTPTGHYYCQNCDLTLNSEMHFKLHLNGKGHHKKIQQK